MSITHLKNALRHVRCTLATRVRSTVLRSTLLATVLASCVAQAAPRFEDTMAQRLQACTACHGLQGRATPDGYQPRLAGKPAGYVFHQLLNFREGRRDYGPMTSLVDPLSDAYLQEIGEYFASLDVAYPPPQAPTATPATLRRGEQLVRQGDASRGTPACQQCHGEAMMGVAPDIPGLLGLPRDYLNAQLGAWRGGKRHAQAPDCMAQVAISLSADDIDALSQWLAAQAVPAHAKPMPEWPAGRKMPLPCGGVSVEAAPVAGSKMGSSR